MIRSWTLATIAAGLATCSSIDVFAADPLPTETFKILPAALAVEAAEAAIASCKGQGYNISVTIVDRAGDLKLLLVGDGASALSRELSRRKAYTSAMRRITTADLAKQVHARRVQSHALRHPDGNGAGWRAHQGRQPNDRRHRRQWGAGRRQGRSVRRCGPRQDQ
jgi:hypothetical protein